MAQCDKCGSENRPNARFCGQCRAPLVEGVGYAAGGHGGQAPQAPPAPPKGNLNPTIPEGAWPAGGGAVGGARVGGAAGETTLEPGQGQGGYGAPHSPLAPPPAQSPGGTVYSEAVQRDMAGWLVVLHSRAVAPYMDVPLYTGQNKLGRTQLMDPEASGDHLIIAAELEPAGVVATLIDQGSRNGTNVNRQRVRTHELQKGDEIRIGKTTFVYVPRPVLKQPVQPY